MGTRNFKNSFLPPLRLSLPPPLPKAITIYGRSPPRAYRSKMDNNTPLLAMAIAEDTTGGDVATRISSADEKTTTTIPDRLMTDSARSLFKVGVLKLLYRGSTP